MMAGEAGISFALYLLLVLVGRVGHHCLRGFRILRRYTLCGGDSSCSVPGLGKSAFPRLEILAATRIQNLHEFAEPYFVQLKIER
jgi:hypothetical protein